MFNDVVTFISITEDMAENGDLLPTESKRDILANVRSIGMKEKYEALSNGLNPEYAVVLADHLDYNGEQYIEYGQDSRGNPVRFRVIRTFQKDGTDGLEIVVTG